MVSHTTYSAKIRTIGCEQTIPGRLKSSMSETLLCSRVADTYAPDIQNLVRVSLYRREFDALVSLNYNIGAKVLHDPTEDTQNNEQQIETIPLLNVSRYKVAFWEFSKCTKGGPERPCYRGLLKRRLAEMFVFRDSTEIPATLTLNVVAYYRRHLKCISLTGGKGNIPQLQTWISRALNDKRPRKAME